MRDQSNRTFVGSVLFLDIIEYSKKSVSEQLKLKQHFNALLTDALAHIAPAERIILDTGDGAAISFLGDPEEALFVAAAMRDAIPVPDAPDHLPVRIGINLGPVRLVKDINGQLNIIGDGINVAQRVMSFSSPGQILASRSYYEVVSRLSDEYAPLFSYEGSRTDKHVREHEVYAVGAPNHALRPGTTTGVRTTEPPAPHSILRARALVAALFLFVFIVGSAVAWRAQHDTAPTVVQTAPAMADPAPPAVKPRPARQDAPAKAPVTVTARTAKPQKNTKNTEPPPAATSVRVLLSIEPGGQVFVDDKSHGMTPPLRSFEIPPGRHKLEIRNSGSRDYVHYVNGKAGETIDIRHKFE